jgi:DNA-binding beta-propeller fold protein YncE
MYWTDSQSDSIYRADLDGSDLETLLTLPGNPSPRGLAVDQINDKIYFANQGAGAVQRSNLDGTAIEDVFTVDGWNGPDGIALDIPSGQVYWTGLNENLAIQRANFDGTNVETLVASGLNVPRHIDVGEAHVVPEAGSLIIWILTIGCAVAVYSRRR